MLAYVWKHRDEEQSYTGLAEGTGIPYETVRQMIQWFQKDPNNWALRNYGTKYGYVVRYFGQRERPRRWCVRAVRTPVGQRVGVFLRFFHAGRPGRPRRVAEFETAEAAHAFKDATDDRIKQFERKIIDVVYIGTTQNADGKLFVEDVPEFHPARGAEELCPEAAEADE